MSDELIDQLPGLEEINRRLVANAREKRLLVQLKKLAEQRERLLEVQREAEE